MLANLDNLGEQTVGKIAEVALASQMKQVDRLSVKVKIEPEQLSQGILTALHMQGHGLVTQSNLRVDNISLHIEEIGVSPFKALMGNIQLTKPAFGNAHLSVKAKDLEAALLTLLAEHGQTQFELRGLKCHFDEPHYIQIKAQVHNKETQTTEPLHLSLNTVYSPSQKEVVIEAFDYLEGETLKDSLGAELQDILLGVLNFRFMIFDGLSFQVKHLEVTKNELKLMAIAKITAFPKKKTN